MKRCKRILSMLLVCCLVVGMLPMTVLAATDASGSCGIGVRWSYDGNSKTLTISGIGKMEDYVHEWGENEAPWCDYCLEIETVEVESGVTRIGNEAFSGRSYPNLTSVSIADSVKEIGSRAFAGTALTSLTLPSSLTTIGRRAFYGSDLKEITIPASVDDIGFGAFVGGNSLSAINVEPGNARYISDGGVLYEKLLGDEKSLLCYPVKKTASNYSVLAGTSKIEEEAFAWNPYLSSVTIPSTVQELPPLAFWFCTSLQSVSLPEGMRSVASDAFWGCYVLSELHIPASVTNFTTEHTPADAWLGEYVPNLSIYFSGSSAPTFDAGIAELHGIDKNTKVTIYYPINATGWSAVQMQEDVKRAVSDGAMEFQTWTPSGGEVVNPPGDSNYAKIVRVTPSNGAADVGYNASDPPAFTITFDRKISSMDTPNNLVFANLDFSKGTMKLFRESDDALIYEVTYDSYVNDFFDITGTTSGDINVTNGNTITLDPFNAHTLLDPATEYYVTVDEGFIRFKDGTVNPAIEKEEWKFTTAGQAATPILKTKGYFKYDSSFSDENGTYPYSYNEAWFLEDSSKYNHELAKMSLAMAMSAFDIGGNTYAARAANVIDLFDQLGFRYTADSICYDTPTTDSIGYAIGSKTVSTGTDTFTLVAVAIRGSGYEQEWASNFTVGTGSEHAGFANAADTVSDAVQSYIKSLGVSTNIKIWITGYSRAAATANIAAQRLTAAAKSKRVSGLSSEGIFAYCFACPRTVRTDGPSYVANTYNNIYNIVNYIDLVPKVAPEDWDFDRYGITYYLPSAEQTSSFSDAYVQMMNTYAGILNQFGFLDVGAEVITATAYSKGQGSTFDDIVDAIASYFNKQDVYSIGYEDQMRIIGADIGTGGAIHTADALIRGLLGVIPAFPVFHPFLSTKLVGNIPNIGRAHYAEQYLAWMNTINGKSAFVSSRVRQLKINCPVNIDVYDSSHVLVAQIVDDTVADIKGSTIAAYLDGDGQKVIILPVDEEYTVEILATDEGTATYTATENNIDTGSIEKVVSYYQIDVVTGDKLIGIVENLDGVDSADYPLYLNNDTAPLDPSVTQNGNEVEEHVVTVSSSGNGIAYGSGNYVSGEHSKVVAVADNGETFLGWYVNDTLVSTDTEYRFLVECSIEITAKFTTNTSSGTGSRESSYTVNVSKTVNGTATVTPRNANKGTVVTITTTPDIGYELANLTVTAASGDEIKLTDEGDGKYTFTMPAAEVTITAIFAESENKPVNPFIDVFESDYYYDAVLWAVESGITSGTSPTTFSPDASCTRAQAITFLWKAVGSPEPENVVNPFVDVAPSAYYYKAVLWAVENGITSGTSATTFSPDMPCTRAQIVTFLWRSAGSETAIAVNPFTDMTEGAYYADAVLWAVKNGITDGTSATTFSPDADCTRGQIVTFLYRNRE